MAADWPWNRERQRARPRDEQQEAPKALNGLHFFANFLRLAVRSFAQLARRFLPAGMRRHLNHLVSPMPGGQRRDASPFPRQPCPSPASAATSWLREIDRRRWRQRLLGCLRDRDQRLRRMQAHRGVESPVVQLHQRQELL